MAEEEPYEDVSSSQEREAGCPTKTGRLRKDLKETERLSL